jgi:transcriptional regulator with XRE-family HTH domain
MSFDALALVGRLVRAREQAGLTQAAVAEAAGVSVETVSRVERALHEPELSTVIALAHALGYQLTLLPIGRADIDGPPDDGAIDSVSPQAQPPSPLVRLLATTAEELDGPSLRAVLRVAELLRGAGRKSRAR